MTDTSEPAASMDMAKLVVERLLPSIESLGAALRLRDEWDTENTGRIQNTQNAIQLAISDLAAKLDAIPVTADPSLTRRGSEDSETAHNVHQSLERALQGNQKAFDQLNRTVETFTVEAGQLRQALNRIDASRDDLAALDAWRDGFIRDVSALLARVEKAAGVPVTDASAPEETALAHVDRITARMVLVEGEVSKATEKMDEAFGTVTTSLTEHGETMRRAEGSNLLTRKQVEFLRTAFDRKEQEYRRLRHFWVSLPVILVVALAGMVLESQLHWFYRLLG